MKKCYLGDSVYVEYENGMLKLTTENGYGPTNTIYMEDLVYRSLVAYVAAMKLAGHAGHERDSSGEAEENDA